MKNRTRLYGSALVVALFVFAAACDHPAGPSPSAGALSGTWFGNAVLPNGYSATMVLQQNGSQVTGTMSLTCCYRDNPLTGTYTTDSRVFTWTVFDDCEKWSGELTLASNSRHMTGPIHMDGSGCAPKRTDANGTVSFDLN